MAPVGSGAGRLTSSKKKERGRERAVEINRHNSMRVTVSAFVRMIVTVVNSIVIGIMLHQLVHCAEHCETRAT